MSTSAQTLEQEPPTQGSEPRDERYYLHRAPVGRALAHLAVPMMIAMSVGVVYNIVNAGFIGSLHSTALLAAITFGLPLTALTMAVGGVFGAGGASAVSRLLGALEHHNSSAATETDDQPDAAALTLRIKQLSAFTVWGSLAAGVLVAVAGLLALEPLTHLLGAQGETFTPTAHYTAVLLAGTPVLVLAFAIEQLVRAEGATRASMVAIVASTVTNFALDVLLILVLHWNVVGAALAVVLSNVVTVAYLVSFLHRRSELLRIGWQWLTLDRSIAAEVFGVGISELLMSGFLIVSSLVFNRIAVGYGDGVLAAFGLAQRIVQLPEALAMGVCLGAMPLLATAHGARVPARLAAALRHSAAWIAVIVAVFALPVFGLRERVLTLFSHDQSVLSTGLVVLAAMLVSALFNGFTGLLVTNFQATGQALPATVLSTAQGLLFVPVLLVANRLFGLDGLIWSVPVSEVACFALAVVLFATRRD